MAALRSILLGLLLLLLPGLAAGADLATFTKAPLTIETTAGTSRFTVELALSPAQETQGLMFRRTMAADAGMLFDLGDNHVATFWMKNTFLPLDMLFVGADGKIAAIHERAVPLSEATISSAVPVRWVLELNGGTVARLGIRPGDRIHQELVDAVAR
jgi:uncharacterized membrane protein (UPF0127 family)